MNLAVDLRDEPLGPWNPGISSSIPRRLLPMSTIFRPEHAFTSVERAVELNELTGLEFGELAALRPQRLALHEVLIRVTGKISVPDGSRYEDLGINFRRMVGVILARYVDPAMNGIVTAYDELRRQLAVVIESEIAAAKSPPAPPQDALDQGRMLSFQWLRRRSRPQPVAAQAGGATLQEAAEAWDARVEAEPDELKKAALAALVRVARALYNRTGHSWAYAELLGAIALDLACNAYCSQEIGRLVEPLIVEAAAAEGYRFLPAQQSPVVINTKGPSASGKSTLRPLQRQFTGRIGVRWDEFALISPDIWRKQLLDYASLGPDHRYGGMLSSEEVAIIDQKLDRYMAREAQRGRIPHLLIDRFRFGSFSASENAAGSLLSRFGQRIYFCFMITPPQDIVERAWKRGLQYGRYKAVDDLLAHSVEAYSGMPLLFLAWAQRTDKSVHYEFLDNSVPLGHRPRTVAFGSNGVMVILDVKTMLDVGRYRTVNINATAPPELYTGSDARRDARTTHADFLLQCVRQLGEVIFADQSSGRIYLHVIAGRVSWVDPEALGTALSDPETARGIAAVAPGIAEAGHPLVERSRYVRDLQLKEQPSTLGDWGGEGG